ncbi:MAG: hypothetical protein MHM6MM_005496 [Cercozoa sp. M6MM]
MPEKTSETPASNEEDEYFRIPTGGVRETDMELMAVRVARPAIALVALASFYMSFRQATFWRRFSKVSEVKEELKAGKTMCLPIKFVAADRNLPLVFRAEHAPSLRALLSEEKPKGLLPLRPYFVKMRENADFLSSQRTMAEILKRHGNTRVFATVVQVGSARSRDGEKAEVLDVAVAAFVLLRITFWCQSCCSNS